MPDIELRTTTSGFPSLSKSLMPILYGFVPLGISILVANKILPTVLVFLKIEIFCSPTLEAIKSNFPSPSISPLVIA